MLLRKTAVVNLPSHKPIALEIMGEEKAGHLHGAAACASCERIAGL